MLRFALPFLVLSLHAAEPDWKAIEAETLEHYSALVRLDTTNPPGNEARAVEYLKAVLDREGIPYKTVGPDPKRLNLIARLKGSGAKKPLLLMGHTDTVSIDPKKWKHGPFSAHREGGYIYGRGTSDDKDSVAAYLMVLLTLKRLNVPLDRDVIFFAESAEESGAASWGAGWVVDNSFADVECEYCLAEGGGFRREGGKLIANMVGTAEKIPRGIRLVARGAAGHGSRPEPGNVVLALTEAVAKIGRWTPPMKLSDTTRAYFERMAAISPPEQAERFNAVVHPERGPEVFRWFQKNDPGHFAMLTNTITPTILKAGFQSNVIPSEAEATIDIRMLPGEDTAAFYDELRKVIANPAIEIVSRAGAPRPTTPPSRIDNEMWKAIEQSTAKLFGGLRSIPVLGVGATDKSYFRAKNVNCYGIGPAIDVEDAPLGFGAHSDQERMGERALHDFVRFAWTVTNEVAARR